MIKDSIKLQINHEPDCYGHLNNSLYSLYFEKARKFILKKAGLDEEKLKQKGIGVFVVASNYKYINQTRKYEEVKIDSELIKEGAKFIVKQKMYNKEEKATGKIEHCLVNLKTGKPKNLNHLEKILNLK